MKTVLDEQILPWHSKDPNNKSIKSNCSNCLISDICLPRGLEQSDVDVLDQAIKHRKLVRKGELIFQYKEKSGCIYAVQSGSVKTQIPLKNGIEKIIGFHLPGELTGFYGLDDKIHNCSGIALENSVICAFPFNELNSLCLKSLKLHSRLINLMRDETTKTHFMLALLANKNPEQRLASFIVNISDRRKERGHCPINFNLSMSRYDIGSYLGLADETISRAFSKLREHQLIEAERKSIKILSYETLRSFSEYDLSLFH